MCEGFVPCDDRHRLRLGIVHTFQVFPRMQDGAKFRQGVDECVDGPCVERTDCESCQDDVEDVV